MASRKILFCLLLFIFAVSVIKCKGGRSGGGSRGGSSSGGGWSSHSSSSYSKPSWSSGSSSSWSSGSYKPSWSSSSSGHSYPSSSTGLSGSGYKPSHSSSSYGYPSSSSGLSGSGSSSYGYPSSSSGLSGSGSGKSSYSSSSSGSYNFGWGVRNPSSGESNYPSSSYGNGISYYTPSSTGQSYGNGYYKTYYSAPQHFYINQYRNSDSRYRHLLSGLALYNIGRSHSYHHDHYYYDDFYSTKYPAIDNNGYNRYSTPQETATCRLKITDRYFTETINIPCEIVSTFTEDSKMVSEEDEHKTIVCVNKTITVYVKDNSTSVLSNPTAQRKEKVITNCKSTATSVDPFSVHGPSLAHYGKDCTIEIQKKDILFHNLIDCTILLDYDQMPQPTIQESSIMPSREKLKSWVSNPPWWMSLFIAV